MRPVSPEGATCEPISRRRFAEGYDGGKGASLKPSFFDELGDVRWVTEVLAANIWNAAVKKYRAFWYEVAP